MSNAVKERSVARLISSCHQISQNLAFLLLVLQIQETWYSRICKLCIKTSKQIKKILNNTVDHSQYHSDSW